MQRRSFRLARGHASRTPVNMLVPPFSTSMAVPVGNFPCCDPFVPVNTFDLHSGHLFFVTVPESSCQMSIFSLSCRVQVRHVICLPIPLSENVLDVIFGSVPLDMQLFSATTNAKSCEYAQFFSLYFCHIPKCPLIRFRGNSDPIFSIDGFSSQRHSRSGLCLTYCFPDLCAHSSSRL